MRVVLPYISMEGVSGGDQRGKARTETYRSSHTNTENDNRLLLALGGRGIGARRPSFRCGRDGHVVAVTRERL